MKLPAHVIALGEKQLRREHFLNSPALLVVAPVVTRSPPEGHVSTFSIPSNPIGKPRMTRRDVWAKRPPR